jgi:hypothetical protein
MVSHFAWNQTQTVIVLPMASSIAGMRGVHHQFID